MNWLVAGFSEQDAFGRVVYLGDCGIVESLGRMIFIMHLHIDSDVFSVYYQHTIDCRLSWDHDW